jgi:hemerythrin superfamily protein
MLSLTDIAGKAVGAAKAASAALSGYRGIFRTLKRDHGEVSVLLMRIQAEKDPHDCARLFPQAKLALTAHARAEELEFYSILSQHDDTRALIAHSESEHDKMEQLLEQLDRLSCSDPAWHPLFRELVRAVQEHVDEEENQVFPRAKRILTAEQAEEIDRRFRREKERQMRAPDRPSASPPPVYPIA